MNISAKVDCSEVAEYMKQFDNVETSRIFSFLCTEQGQKLIMDDIKEKKINRVVVAA